jgi:hypothetical protein
VGLAMDRLCEYDEVAAHAVEHTPAARLKERLRRTRERLQADTAVARRELAEQQRRVEVEPLADGEAALIIRGPAPAIVAIDHALTAAAVAAHGRPGEDRAVGALRYDIAQDLLLEGIKQASSGDPDLRVPQRKGVLPHLYLTVPVLTMLGQGTEPATLEGYGPIDIETARRLAAAAPSLVRILTHPLSGVRLAMDGTAYAVPPGLRRWLQVRDELCRGPGCRRPAHLCDIDHVKEWQHGGGTNEDNLVALCRPDHLLKTFGLWKSQLRADGVLIWTSPWGRTFPSEPAEPGEPAPAQLLTAVQGEPPADAADDCPF